MDNHTEKIVLEKNIRPISFILKECTGAPFLAEYSEQVNIPICTGATSNTMESGEVIILIFGQDLWFDNSMEKILINPNQ